MRTENGLAWLVRGACLACAGLAWLAVPRPLRAQGPSTVEASPATAALVDPSVAAFSSAELARALLATPRLELTIGVGLAWDWPT